MFHIWKLTSVLIVCGFIWIFAKYYEIDGYHDFLLEWRIHAALGEFKDRDGSIHVANLLHRPVRKICFQGPYEWKEHAEDLFKEKLPVFHPLDEDRFIWWFFYQDGSSAWVSVPRVDVMDVASAATQLCVTSSDPVIAIGTPDYHGPHLSRGYFPLVDAPAINLP